MQLQITINAQCKRHLVKAMSEVLDNISTNGSYYLYHNEHKFKHGSIKIEQSGGFAHFAVLDENDDYVSFHDTRASANEAAGNDLTVIKLKNGMPI